MDTERTLAELQIPDTAGAKLREAASKALKVLKMSAAAGCAAVKAIYSENTYETILSAGILTKTVSPYKVIETGTDYIIIDKIENGGIIKIHFTENSFYVA